MFVCDVMDVRWSSHSYDNKDNLSFVLSLLFFLSSQVLMAQENNGMQNAGDDLLNAFRAQYQHFSTAIPGAIQSNVLVDPVSLARLGDDLDEYCNLAQEVRHASFQ
jgi:hypothetical protein